MHIERLLSYIEQNQPKHPELLKQLWREVTTSSKSFDQLIVILSQHPTYKKSLAQHLKTVFLHKDLTYSLVESGISSRTGFTSELIRKLKHTLLPEQKSMGSFQHTLTAIVKDKRLKREQLITLFTTLGLTINFNRDFLKNELMDAIEVLSYRVTATAIESEFIQKFKHNETLRSFIDQNKKINELLLLHQTKKEIPNGLIECIQQLLNHSLNDIHILTKSAHHQGISLQLSYSLHRITQQLERLKILIELSAHSLLNPAQLATMIEQLLDHEHQKNSIRKQLNDTTYLLAHQITEHESKTGEHYIAENKEAYVQMFRSSCGGGVFASIMTLLKLLLHHLPLAPFWQAFSYSLNYAAGFVGIQLTHATLATKQPAMTASKIAHALDTKDQSADKLAIQSLALMIGKVARSQFISFVGNLVVVFPLSFSIAWIWSLATGHDLVNEKEAMQMLHDVHPYKNPTWLYACITGFFLFISGIISGYYDNKVIYSKIPSRLRHHPLLQRVLPKRALVSLTHYIEHNLGSLIGNICLGFFLGTAGFIGFIFGLPFDIRHITISSGNYAIAVFTLFNKLSWGYALTCLTGVLGIGVFNFLISFGLAIFVAARSRRVKSTQFIQLIKWTGVYFKKYPKDFFTAPTLPRSTDDLN